MSALEAKVWFGVAASCLAAVGCETSGGGEATESTESEKVARSAPGKSSSATTDRELGLPEGFSVEEREPGRRVAFDFQMPSAGRWRWRAEIRETVDEKTRRVAYRYDREVGRFGGGRSLARGGVALLEVEADSDRKAREAVDWYRDWFGARPPYAVDSYGRITRLVASEGADALPRREARWRRPGDWGDESNGTSSGGRTSHYTPESRVRADWYWTRRFWEGREAEVGASYRATVDAPYPSPLLGRVRMRIRVEFEVVGGMPCRSGDRACVVVRARLEPDGEQLRAALRAYVADLTPSRAANVDVHLADATSRVVLLVEPEGLRHWRRHWTSRDRFDVDVGGRLRQLRAERTEIARAVEHLADAGGKRPEDLERGD